MVRVAGVEPVHLSAQDPKSCVSANSTIPAYCCYYNKKYFSLQYAFSKKNHSRIQKIYNLIVFEKTT